MVAGAAAGAAAGWAEQPATVAPAAAAATACANLLLLSILIPPAKRLVRDEIKGAARGAATVGRRHRCTSPG
ncbi:hypothetical protein GCM10027598_81770 [Amycolatopsis oliviviridis]|uniref:Uncharacterized protein n=1 Tax=Amycolatopsis oliviviridis TaxID=1471590 RepID=A0ABQ3L8F5_9PSEU|nr:hypothetical protein GCM10017790_11660 [Amycolatopsis oliviviridis]